MSVEGYRIGAAIGQGAVARVVEVHAPDGRALAGKILHESHRDDPAAAARFSQEAAILAGLRHPNLVAVDGIMPIDGTPVLVMERVDGPDLAHVIAREAPLDEVRLRGLLHGIAAGLAAAHAAGVVHRDLKPSNVLVAPGDIPKIADFGMARASSLAGVDRNAFAVLGTPDYMAPESIDPLAVDPRTDLYALGCIAFEAATGRPPFGGATAMAVIQAHRDAPIPELPDRYSDGLRALVRELLAKSPADRPPAATAVCEALDRLDESPVALARRDPQGAPADVRGSDRCARCGRRVVVEAGVCIGCGAGLARLEPGEHSLLVVGPGAPGDKLDSELRERLRRWLVDNPSLRLDPAGLQKQIPRLPFTLATRLSESSGLALVGALRELGLEAELVRGGPLASAAMRTKTKRLWGRAALIVMTSCAGILGNAGFVGVLASIVIMLSVVSIGTVVFSTRRVTVRARAAPGLLPAQLQVALGRIAPALPAIESERHREGLRAVVERTATLARRLPSGDRETAEELARAVDCALVAAAKLDALDRELAAMARDEAGEAQRERLRERDTWAARLLALTAALDVLTVRLVRSPASDERARDAELAAVREHIEALEEVQAR